jgi:hypothetical protein
MEAATGDHSGFADLLFLVYDHLILIGARRALAVRGVSS